MTPVLSGLIIITADLVVTLTGLAFYLKTTLWVVGGSGCLIETLMCDGSDVAMADLL